MLASRAAPAPGHVSRLRVGALDLPDVRAWPEDAVRPCPYPGEDLRRLVKACPTGSAGGGSTCGCRAERRWWTHGPPPVNPTTSESRTFGKAPMRTAGAA